MPDKAVPAVARFLEDFQVGETWTSREVVLSEEDIIRFGRENDPQPIHTDPAAATNSRFGGVIASGWQIAVLSMRLFVEAGGYGKTPMVGLGIDELRWRQIVRPGDKLRVERKVIEVRRSKSRPQFGVIRTLVTATNQNSEAVMTLVSAGQVPARSTAGD